MIYSNKLSEILKIALKKENIYSILLVFLIFAFDRYSKFIIINKFNENILYINNFINFDLIWNTGIGFGLLSSNSILFYNFITIFIIFVVIILFYIVFKGDNNEKFILSLVIGGAIGNLYDRVSYNAVPDFIDLHYGNFHWFTFNVADIFITLGITVFIMIGIFKKDR
ncbi:signal peptidase II [Pelagibacteraceae bacterium]|jgi:signal peptidase II|nr:signal peptidase II [Pelagibacteraceae bacterium]